MTDKYVTFVHLVQDQKLGIRLVDVSVDEIAGAGGRAIFELLWYDVPMSPHDSSSRRDTSDHFENINAHSPY